MPLRTHPAARPSRRHRLGLTLTAAVLPLTLAACGSTASTTGSGSSGNGSAKVASTPGADISKAYDNLMKAKSATFTLSLKDADGNLKKAASEGKDGLSPAAADALLNGTVSLTIDPSGDLTLGQVTDADPGASLQDSLSRVNIAVAVKTGDKDLLGLRLVDGTLFARVDFGTLDQIAAATGSDPISPSLDEAGQSLPQLGAAITDLKAGKWLKLDLAPLAGQLESLTGAAGGASPSAMPQLDGQKLATDLVAAVKPFTEVTGGKDGKYDVSVKARGAVTAAANVLADSLGGLGTSVGISPDTLRNPDLGGLQDGPLTGTVELDGDSFKQLTLDLSSIKDVVPATENVPDLAGGTVVLDIKDDADQIKAPDNVSAVDLNALLTQFLGVLGQGLTGGMGGITPPQPS